MDYWVVDARRRSLPRGALRRWVALALALCRGCRRLLRVVFALVVGARTLTTGGQVARLVARQCVVLSLLPVALRRGRACSVVLLRRALLFRCGGRLSLLRGWRWLGARQLGMLIRAVLVGRRLGSRLHVWAR